jgi:hypothetical protein
MKFIFVNEISSCSQNSEKTLYFVSLAKYIGSPAVVMNILSCDGSTKRATLASQMDVDYWYPLLGHRWLDTCRTNQISIVSNSGFFPKHSMSQASMSIWEKSKLEKQIKEKE